MRGRTIQKGRIRRRETFAEQQVRNGKWMTLPVELLSEYVCMGVDSATRKGTGLASISY